MREMKDSGIEWIGDIPVSWDTIKLKFHGKIYNGSTPKSDNPEYYDGDITWVTPADMDNASTIINSKKTITEAGLESCGTNLVPKNSIVISTRAPIGVVCIAGKELCTNQGCKSIVPKDISCAKYPYYFLLTQSDTLNMLGKGTTFLELSTSDLSNYKIPFPAKKEQQAIADYLDVECARIDGIVTIQHQIIERLKEYKKSVITEAVTRGLNPNAPMKDSGIEWIGKIPEHWEVRRIKTLGEYRNGLTYNPENMVDESSGTLVLRSSNIQNGKIVLDDNVFVNNIIPEQLLVHKGDIIICSRNGSRELVGKNALIKEDIMASFGAFMMIFRTNYPEYISYILNSAIFGYYLSTFFTATINQLTGSNFGNMQIVFCPDLNEQQEIIDYLDRECARIDAIIEKRERMIELMTEYKKSLIYECVTGKKEIVDVVE